jgi:predicted AlkP superfamily pyrophosphatase or phosphodiesterase
MILEGLEETVSRRNREGLILPRYDGYSLLNVPNTAFQILGFKPPGPALSELITKHIDASGIKKVLLLLIDGFGYKMFLDSYRKSGLFKAIAEHGIVAPITSNFPPTTAASITTMNTGLTPQQHALQEWNLYFNEVDEIIKPLPLTTIDNKHEPLTKIKENPAILYNGSTIYEEMNKQKLKSVIVQTIGLASSTYNKLMNRGAEMITYTTASDMALKSRKAIEEINSGYVYAYTDYVDFTAHVYGPQSNESVSEIINLGEVIQRNLIGGLSRKVAEETLFMITADHGHIQVDPKKIIFLEEDKLLAEAYEIGPRSKPILPCGLSRDVFLHIRKEMEDEIIEHLSRKLIGRAKVIKTEDAVRMGLFGVGTVNREFFNRVGNVIILPEDNIQVWYNKTDYDKYQKGNKPQLLGMHGGISEDEMIIPFAACRLSELY